MNNPSLGQHHNATTANPELRPVESVRKELLRGMVNIRVIEEEIARRYAEQEMRCPTHFCIGQEAVAVGLSVHLGREDMVFSGHRSHGHYLAKGGDLPSMVAELYGREAGCAGGRGGSQHLIDLDVGFMGSAPILASTVAVGVGAAFGSVALGQPRVVVIYVGDGATEEGAFHEAMNFASVEKLPVIFACENNLYSVHSPLDVRQPKRPLTALAGAHGMLGLECDGNDVEAVWRVGGEMIERARRGGGPSFIEFATYRVLEHCGPNPDDQLGYRPASEVDQWRRECPIKRYVKQLGAASDQWVDEWSAHALTEVGRALDRARQLPFPDPSSLTLHVYPQ